MIPTKADREYFRDNWVPALMGERVNLLCDALDEMERRLAATRHAGLVEVLEISLDADERASWADAHNAAVLQASKGSTP